VEVPEAVSLAAELIKLNTSNPGQMERGAASLVADALREAGASIRWFEPEPGRVSLVARIAGDGHGQPPLLVHSHLDVVPAVDSEWTSDPYGGDIVDGYLWGRGAVDMKGTIGCVLGAVRAMAHAGLRPQRDLVLAFFADEEAGGQLGAAHVVREAPELFGDCREAIGEVGGFSYSLAPGRRAYFVATAEKGVCWTRLIAHGRSGHGSMINPDNPIDRLADTLTRMRTAFNAAEPAPTATARATLDALRIALDRPGATGEEMLAVTGPLQRMLRAGLRDTVNPTELQAGFKANVVPGTASATLDGRFVPGAGAAFTARLIELAGERTKIETLYYGDAVEAPLDSPLLDAIGSALVAEDAAAVVVPYMSTAFTDAKWLSKLGIHCYGFAPMQLPDDLDFTALFHGVDERVPVAALDFGTRVLQTLFAAY
jgi:acetylornithine deacetylase/succinyl-diaminopimelate desuccinylase-like protein